MCQNRRNRIPTNKLFRGCEHKIQKVLLNAEKGLSGEFQDRLYNFRVAYPYFGNSQFFYKRFQSALRMEASRTWKRVYDGAGVRASDGKGAAA